MWSSCTVAKLLPPVEKEKSLNKPFNPVIDDHKRAFTSLLTWSISKQLPIISEQQLVLSQLLFYQTPLPGTQHGRSWLTLSTPALLTVIKFS